MKASASNLLIFLKNSIQFVVPIYQRNYSWTEREVRQLWDDIIRTGSREEISSHFVGSIVYIERGEGTITEPSPFLVIDGQQRLTSLTLILEALSKAVGTAEPIRGFSEAEMHENYLFNKYRNDEQRFKLLLSQIDKDTLITLIEHSSLPNDHSVRIVENYELIKGLINEHQSKLDIICNGLAKLRIVDISLDPNVDNPQLIFESLNSTGLELKSSGPYS